jgi:hypothetical protein
MNRSVDGVSDEICECCGQERDELGPRHLARGHRELAMLDFAKAADIAADRHIVRRVAEDHFRPFALHKHSDDSRVERIAANESMRSHPPDIADTAARRNFVQIRASVVGRIAGLLAVPRGVANGSNQSI